MIQFSIDLKLIDQSRCKKMTRKNGQAASFCDFILIETPDSEYGEYAVKQSMSKEERESGVKMPIIGNGKNPKPRQGQAPAQRPPAKRQADPDLDTPEDSVPF